MNFTILERVVIESIFKGNKTVKKIVEDTSLNSKLIEHITTSLCEAKLLEEREGEVKIPSQKRDYIIQNMQNKKNQMIEMNTLIKSCMRKSVQGLEKPFHFKKVFMDDKEQVILQGLLNNVDNFLKSVESNRGKTKNETIIFWGSENYASSLYSYMA